MNIYSSFETAAPAVEGIKSELRRSQEEIAVFAERRKTLEQRKAELLACAQQCDEALQRNEQAASPAYKRALHCRSLLNSLSDKRAVPLMGQTEIVACLRAHNLSLGNGHIKFAELDAVSFFDKLFAEGLLVCNLVAVTWDLRNHFVSVNDQQGKQRRMRFNYDACGNSECCFCCNEPFHSDDHTVLPTPLLEVDIELQ